MTICAYVQESYAKSTYKNECMASRQFSGLSSRKFWTASALIKENTLARFFDMDKLFGAFTPQTLPSRYLRTYANIEKMWGQTPLELATRKGGDAT